MNQFITIGTVFVIVVSGLVGAIIAQGMERRRIMRRIADYIGQAEPDLDGLLSRLFHRGPAAVPMPEDPRLSRLEMAVDAVAIEVERMAEGQRFVAKLLAERATGDAGRSRSPIPGAGRNPSPQPRA